MEALRKMGFFLLRISSGILTKMEEEEIVLNRQKMGGKENSKKSENYK